MLRTPSSRNVQPVSAIPVGDRFGPGPRRSLLPLLWVLLGVLVLATDYADVTGLYVRFPAVFIVPVALAARFSGPWWGLFLAFALPLVHLFVLEEAQSSWMAAEAAVAAVIRINILALIVLAGVREVERRIHLREVGFLRGLFKVCTSCRRIRGREDLWMPAEEYVATCPEAVFRHGTCPECMRAYLGRLLKRDAEAWRRWEQGTQGDSDGCRAGAAEAGRDPRFPAPVPGGVKRECRRGPDLRPGVAGW
jgi:hypothetical protein